MRFKLNASNKTCCLVLLILFLASRSVYAETAILIGENQQQLGNSISIFHDSQLHETEYSVLNQPFTESTRLRVKLFDTEGQYWIKFKLVNAGQFETKRLISINYAHIKKFSLFEMSDGGIHKVGSVNSATPASERRVFSRFPVLELSVKAQSEQAFLLNVQLSHFPLDHEIKLYPLYDFYAEQIEYLIFLCLFSGFLLALVLYNLSLFVSLLTPRYLYFCVFAFFLAFIVLGYDGLLYLLPWAPSVEFVSFIITRGSVIGGFLWISYLQHTLDLKKSFRRINKAADIAKICSVVVFIISIAFEPITIISDIGNLPVFLVSIYLTISFYKKGSKAALHISIASLLMMLGIISDSMVFSAQDTAYDLALYDSDLATWLRDYALYLFLLAAMFFMSWALAVFVRQVRDEKEQAQQKMLELLIESNDLKDGYAHQLENDIEKATEQLRDKTEQLQQLDKQKSRFFTNISHEFRTPLTLIKGPVEELTKEHYGAINNRGKLALDICSRNIQRLSRLIDELLLLAELEVGVTKLKTCRVDINQFSRRTAALFTHKAQEKKINFVIDIPTDQTLAFVDTSKFEKVIFNLLSNALKFTPANGEVIFRVSLPAVDTNETGTFVDVQIEDSGPGISIGSEEKIFDRFYRTQQTDDSEIEGTGIGLALVQELVALHGGDVSVNSRESGGSIFTVSLPLGYEHLGAGELAGEITTAEPDENLLADNEDSYTEKTRSSTILLVEDNQDMRSFVSSQFNEEYRVIEAENGIQALEYLSNEPIDLIISDVMMPEMDGISLLEQVRNSEKWHKMPFILLTAKASEEDRLLALKAQADDYIAKPFNAEELKLKVGNMLRKGSIDQSLPLDVNQKTSVAELDVFENNQFLNKAREIILGHISDGNFGVDAFAEKLHMSRSTLQRHIETEGNMTAAAFMRQIRLEQAHQFISHKSHRTLAETAYAVGFNNPGYFSKLYKIYANQLSTN